MPILCYGTNGMTRNSIVTLMFSVFKLFIFKILKFLIFWYKSFKDIWVQYLINKLCNLCIKHDGNVKMSNCALSAKPYDPDWNVPPEIL